MSNISFLPIWQYETIETDIDFVASSVEDVTISITKPIREILRGRLWIDTDPGAGFAQWCTLTFYNKAAMASEDAFYRTSAKLVYTELEAATTGSDANIQPDDHTDFTPNDLVLFQDDDEKARLLTVANIMVAEENVAAHIIDTGLVRVVEFSGFPLFNNEDGANVYCRVSFAAVQTVSLKIELLLRK